MLRQRSFKSAKCKTALKLAVSRIKLLKNKKEAYVKQLRRELARLLQAGNDYTATIRVEHVVREEKTIAAYDLIEIYCELIAARLPVIESQKKCPIDLKEAISSVIFAYPRCSDIPELMDVQKHIIAKYGKEFVSSAAELRPDCGVNCLLVEKLSAKAPDGPTKIKILTAIADDHGIKWQPKQFGENDAQSSQDPVAGSNALEKATFVEPPQVYVPNVQDEKGPPNLHAFYQFREIHDIPTNSYEHIASVATRKAGGDRSKTSSGGYNPEIRSSGTGSQRVDFRDSYAENKQNWNMEFKDAASAAKAAAESAEHASMAARAAVQLSNREKLTRQYSSGPHSSYGSESRSEVPQGYAFHAGRSSFGKHNEQINVREQDYQSSAFGNDNPFAYSSQMADDIYPHNNSFKQENTDFLHEVSTKKNESRTEVDFVSEMHADIVTKNNDHIGDARSRTNRQFGKASSSHFVIPSDDYNDYTFVVDKEYNRQESGLFFSSPTNTNSFSPGQAIDRKELRSSSQSLFTAVSETLPKAAVSYGKEDSFPDIFYDSDGPSSDSDEDYVKSVSGNFGYENSVIDQSENYAASGTSSSRTDERVVYHRKSRLSPSSISSDIMEEDFKRNVSIKTVSGYNRPPYTKSKSVELKHKTFQNEQSSSRVSYQRMNRSDNWASSEHGTEQHAAYKKNSDPNNRFSRVQSSSSVPKIMIPDSDEVAPKSSNFDGGVPSQERPRPSHVHPKLPEYESLTTYFLSLKKGPQ